MARKRSLDTAAVVQAAAALADSHGLEALTLAQLAAELEIKVPSLYNHVAGLAGLRRELALAGMHASADYLRRAAVGKAGDAAVRAVLRAYRDFARAHPGLYTASLRAPSPDDATLQAASADLLEVVVAVLAPYGLGEEASLHAVRGLRSLVHGFVELEAAGGFGLPLASAASFDWLVERFVEGLHHERQA